MVHRVRERELGRCLPEDEPQVWRGRKLAGFVEDGRCHLQAILRRVLAELIVPEPARHRIGGRLYDAASEIGIGIEARQVDEGGAR
jgi:hypothetical protein